MIKNLVFKGGGVLGIAYAGAIKELELRGVTANIEKVAGTSAGSIVACLLALKYKASEIELIVKTTDFKKFEDGNSLSVLGIVNKFGIHPGDNFLNWIKDKIKLKGLSENATFADFASAGFLDLHVFATDLNVQALKKFSASETPNTRVCEAIRASMSIPLFFQAFKFSNNVPDSHIYVDGGCIYNYPLTCFDIGGCNSETLGLFLGDLNNARKDNGLSYGHLCEFIKCLAPTVLDSQNIDLQNDAEDLNRTIMIDSLGISATNFGLTNDEAQKLSQSGQAAVILYFAKQL